MELNNIAILNQKYHVRDFKVKVDNIAGKVWITIYARQFPFNGKVGTYIEHNLYSSDYKHDIEKLFKAYARNVKRFSCST